MNIDQVIERNFSKISDEYRDFAKSKSSCRKCSIFEYSKQVGQSEGNAVDPTFIFVGEALGKDETEQVRPFIGKAGQRLRSEIRKHKEFTRESCLITNVLACRPPNNKFPRDTEGPWETFKNGKRLKVIHKSREIVNHCATNWMRQELKMLKPKVIVTLGSQALDFVRGDRGITSCRGEWKFLPAYRAWSMATFHPSYVLRNGGWNKPDAEIADHSIIVQQFEEDIAKIANTWRSIVSSDPRMSMTKEEWKKHNLLDRRINAGLEPEVQND